VFQKKVEYSAMVFTNREPDGFEIFKLAIDKIRMASNETLNRFEIAGDGSAEHRPNIDAAAAPPELVRLALEFLGLHHVGNLPLWCQHIFSHEKGTEFT